MTVPAVAIDRVTKRYAQVVAVDDVSIDVAKGEFVTLLGPSGCGKSTLLRLVSGFLEPEQGDIRLQGASVLGVPPYRRNTSMVFQDYALFPHRSVAQNLAFGLRMRKVARADIDRRVGVMLELLGLPSMGDRRISEISGGQQQRVALGRALIVEPAVLLLDEPLGALDFKLRKQMQSELKGIQRRVGITFLYVTHDQEEALTMSDRIAVMNRGRVEQLAGPEDVYRRPASAFVADFVGETNLIDCVVERIDGMRARVRTAGGDAFEAGMYGGTKPTVGGTVRLVVRPESITIRPGPDGDGILRGTVAEVVFSGPVAKIVATLPDGTRLQANLTPGAVVPAQGAVVDFTWPRDAAVIVT